MSSGMAEGYEDWLQDDSTNLKRMWVEEGSPGAIVNCIFQRKPHMVILEIYRQDFRMAFQEISDFPQTDEGFTLSQAFETLGPGFYQLKCLQKDQYNIIKYAHSVMFRLE